MTNEITNKNPYINSQTINNIGYSRQTNEVESIFENGSSIFNADEIMNDDEIMAAFDLAAEEADIDEENAKDKTIENTKQGSQGDCSLLSAVNSLSYTEKGREIIKNAIEYNDGYTTVHLAVGDYVVTDEEYKQAQDTDWFSTGDEDMTILECAIEKALDDYADGKLDIPEKLGYIFPEAHKTDKTANISSTSRGNNLKVWYLLTGKVGTRATDDSTKNSQLDDFENNSAKDIAATCAIFSSSDKDELQAIEGYDGYYYITDLNNEQHKVGTNHAYSIKNVTDTTVTFTNPWDSGDDVTISREEFLKVFDETYSVELE